MNRSEHSVKGAKGMAQFEQSGRGSIKRFAQAVLDHIYPPACVNCDAVIGTADSLCPECWGGLRPITSPMCPVLGLPFEVSIGPDARSAEAIANPPPFRRARSALVHNDVARTIVSRLKFGDRPELAKFCARLMYGAGAELFENGDDEQKPVLVPVPLHRVRQWRRRYNQANELARFLGRLGNMEVLPFLVRRSRATRAQIGLSARQRARNVAGAFEVTPDSSEMIAGRRIIIVDDVVTTGSTVSALSKALHKKGMANIDVISFSRVVIGEDTVI